MSAFCNVRNLASCTAIVLVAFSLYACEDHNSNGSPEFSFADESDFQDSANVSIQLTEGFVLSLWAPGPLLANAVAISMDNQGAAYVSETQRRKSSDLDIRSHREWMTEDLALQNLDDTKNFHLEKLASENSEQNSWMEDFNGDGLHDWRDLTVQSERIRKIWDSDGDGRADISSVYAKDINEMLSGVAAGILFNNNDVFLTAAPNLYLMKDLDGDGDADERKILSHGYGIHIAYAGHDMSGLTMGPDGKVYWSIGDIGVNVLDKQGNHFAYPNQGAVMRCNPDGTDFEVYAHGFRNPQELAFDKYGNLISVDNDGDHPGEHERFIHILEGSDSGWRINWQFGKYNQPNEGYKVWMAEKLHLPHFPGQAAYILPPLALAPDGPAGLVYQPGLALNDQWKDYFFGSYFKASAAKSEIQAFRLEPNGASFNVVETRDILSGIVSTGLAFGPDGALYINDWLDGYALKEAGRIWRLDVQEKNSDKRKQTQALLKGEMQQQSISELELLLGYEDMRVRLNAQFELVKRNEKEAFMSVLETQNPEMAQIHAIWGLGQLLRNEQSIGVELVPFLKLDNPEIRGQTAKVLGDAKFKPAADELLNLLGDESVRTKYFAAEALGKIAEERAFQPILNLIEDVGDSDPHFRHGLIHALYRLGMEKDLVALATHTSLSVRLGAVVALRRMHSPGLREFLQDKDTLVLVEAARAIHDDQSVPEALPALAESLLSQKVSNEAFIRRAINANLRIGNNASANRIASYAANSMAPNEMRKDALWALGYWKKPPLLDRVEGRYRELPSRDPEDAKGAFSSVHKVLLASDNIAIRTSAVAAVGRLEYRDAEATIASYCIQKSQPLEVRRAALQTLSQLNSSSIEKALEVSLEDRQIELRTDAQAILGSLNLPPEKVVEMLDKILVNATIKEQQMALSSLAKIDHQSAEVVLNQWLELFLVGAIDPALRLDVMMAVEESTFEFLKEKLDNFESSRASAPAVDHYLESAYGGTVSLGQRIFFENNSAQCIRCHKLDGYGGEVGPDLTGIASKLDPNGLIEALIDPSVRLAPGYGTLSLELKTGERLIGVSEGETTDSVTIRTSDGSIQSYSKHSIKSKSYAPSAMPSMENILRKSEIRDLMAFLKELR